MKYNIPTDTGEKYWRWRKLIELCKLERLVNDDPSPTLALKYYCDKHCIGPNDRVWLSFLYGLTYSVTTTLFIYNRFSSPSIMIKDNNLERFWGANKEKLYFNRDRRYIKSNNQFCDAVRSFTKDMEHKWIYTSFIDISDQQLYKRIIKNWKYFGRHGAFLFFDAYSLLVRNGECDLNVIDNWKEALTIAKGLAVASREDEMLERLEKKQVTDEDAQRLNYLARKLQHQTKMKLISIESSICAYYKFYKGTRYLGYYIDRFQDELIEAEKNSFPKKLVQNLWEIRKEIIPAEYLGELNGWKGIQKHRCKAFLQNGIFR